jgi:hypothetical protein
MRSSIRIVVALAIGCLGAVIVGGLAAASTGTPRPNGTLLRQPHDARTVTLAPTAGCQTLLRTGIGDCGVVHAAGGDLVFTVEPAAPATDGDAARPWTVTVFRASPSPPNRWQVALVTMAQDGEPGPLYANVTAKTADLTADGHQSLVLGYRAEGTGAILDLDIVLGTRTGPRVAAHSELYKGVVQILPGRLVTYAPTYRARDSNCCPSFTQRDEIRYRRGAFVVSPGRRVPTTRVNIPPGDLG